MESFEEAWSARYARSKMSESQAALTSDRIAVKHRDGDAIAEDANGNVNNALPLQEARSSAIHQENEKQDFTLGWRFYLIFASLAVASLAAALDATSLTVPLPIITRDLHGTGIEAFWAGTSYLLSSTVVQPTFASLSHIFGRKAILLITLVCFLVGAIVSAASKHMTLLLIGRSLQGVGAGGVIALSEIVVTDLVALRLRGKWFGYLSIMWVIGSISGPVIGGAFAKKDLWRWIFWINLPLCVIALLMVGLFLRLHLDRSTIKQKLKRIDWVGTVWFIASTTSILIPVSWGGVVHPWDSWRTLVPLLLGIAGLFVLVFWELRIAVEASLRLSIFRTGTAKVAFFTTFLHGLIIFLQLYYLPLYFEAVKQYSPIISGLAVFPQTLTVAPTALVAGVVISATGNYQWLLWIGWALTTLGTGVMYLLDVRTSIPAWIFLNLTSGLGLGCLYPAMAFAIQASVQNEDIAFAVAAYSFFRSFGSAFGVAIGGNMFQNIIRKKLRRYPLLAPYALKYSKDSPTLVQTIKQMDDGLIQKAQLIQAFADTLKDIWVLACAVSGFALLVSFSIKHYSLDVVLETQQGLVRDKTKPQMGAPATDGEGSAAKTEKVSVEIKPAPMLPPAL